MGVLRAGERGQATVEAAFLIPVLFTVLLLSVQPGMVLYDRKVMQAAVSDACRLVAVKTDAGDQCASPVRTADADKEAATVGDVFGTDENHHVLPICKHLHPHFVHVKDEGRVDAIHVVGEAVQVETLELGLVDLDADVLGRGA